MPVEPYQVKWNTPARYNHGRTRVLCWRHEAPPKDNWVAVVPSLKGYDPEAPIYDLGWIDEYRHLIPGILEAAETPAEALDALAVTARLYDALIDLEPADLY